MGKFACFVLTKDREFWLDDSYSHSEIISANDLHEQGSHGPNVVKVVISPTDKIKKWPSLEEWAFYIDQHVLPEWADAKECEKRTREALQRRFKAPLKTIYARGCTALTELKADAAETIDASGCTALTELKADAATYIDARGCSTKLVIKAKKGCVIYR